MRTPTETVCSLVGIGCFAEVKKRKESKKDKMHMEKEEEKRKRRRRRKRGEEDCLEQWFTNFSGYQKG